jgi:uncharacterized protein (DUF983 family)
VTPPSTPATKFKRALLLRCPRCGGGGILKSWLRMRENCPTCGLALERGESSDFWIGAYVFNLVIGEVWLAWDLSFRPAEPGDE